MQKANEQMREALTESIHELFLSEDGNHSSKFLEVLNEIRSDLNLIMIDSKYVETHIWTKFRTPASMQQTLIATTATFLMGVDDLDNVIQQVVTRWVPFTERNDIVDDETLQKAVDHSELTTILKNNYWLLFIIYATLNMRVVLDIAAGYAPADAKNGGKQ